MPFFVNEVVRLLASQGRLGDAEADLPVLAAGLPEGVRAVVAERLGRLSDGCQGVLEVAAALGRDLQLPALEPPPVWIRRGCWSCWRRPRPPG